MSYVLLDQGRELPNHDKSWTSPTGSGPGVPLTAAVGPGFFTGSSILCHSEAGLRSAISLEQPPLGLKPRAG